MNQAIIIIPVYKTTPNKFEIISFNQCLKVLYKHPITIITFKELDIFFYIELLENAKVKFNIEYFDEFYFKNIYGYNRLLLSLNFYSRFKSYEYLLIYQLDAFIFRDELDYWCDQGYDYIGAPLVEDKYGANNIFFLNDFNGGFSLRKIDFCIKLLSYKGPVIKPSKVYEITKKEFDDSFHKRIIYTILRSLGRQNTIKYFVNENYINEDLLFCLGLHISWVNAHINKNEAWIFPKLPNISTAMNFAFERYPEYIYKQNNEMLPFGCHAWEKYEYETFWKKYIEAK